MRNPSESKPPKTRGFTLVELMVTIVIVSALAALSFSVVSSIRAKAESAASMANLRQLALGVHNMASDSNRYPSSDWTAKDYWFTGVFEDITGLERPKGPHRDNSHVFRGTIFHSPLDPDLNGGFSYGYNGWMHHRNDTGERGRDNDGPLKTEIRNSELTVMLADDANNAVLWSKDFAYRNSGETANVVFFDGHAVAMTHAEVEDADKDRRFMRGRP